MKLKNILKSILVLLTILAPTSVKAIGYPALDTTSKWNIGAFGYTPGVGVYFQQVSKNVWTSPGVSQAKMVFYELSVVGVKKGNTEYYLNSPFTFNDITYGMSPGYNYFLAHFVAVAPNVDLDLHFQFEANGKYYFAAVFSGTGYVATDNWTVITKMDYDIEGAGNNTAEFLWNQNSEGTNLSPPIYPDRSASDGLLGYSLAGSGKSDYWSTTSHEIAVAYPKLKRTGGPSVENMAFARLSNATDPEFGLVLFSDSLSTVESVFKAYASGSTINPSADISSTLQITVETSLFPRHANYGRDQMMYLKLGGNTANTSYRFTGKLFQRPLSTRPLLVRVYQHQTSDMGGWRFDPDMVVRTVGGVNRTFRNALSDLTGTSNLVIQRSGDAGLPFISYTGYPAAGQTVSENVLNTMMMNTRQYTSANLNNVREWQIDIYIVNWTLYGEPDTWETMFDYGGYNTNHIPREGAAVFWKSLASKGTDFQRKQTILSALRGVGMALNISTQWGSCPFSGYCWNDATSCGGRRCGATCPAGSSGCRVTAYNCEKECHDGSIMSFVDYNHSTMKFNTSPAPGSSRSEVDWYKTAPEAWVKPGSNGISYIDGPMPSF